MTYARSSCEIPIRRCSTDAGSSLRQRTATRSRSRLSWWQESGASCDTIQALLLSETTTTRSRSRSSWRQESGTSCDTIQALLLSETTNGDSSPSRSSSSWRQESGASCDTIQALLLSETTTTRSRSRSSWRQESGGPLATTPTRGCGRTRASCAEGCRWPLLASYKHEVREIHRIRLELELERAVVEGPARSRLRAGSEQARAEAR